MAALLPAGIYSPSLSSSLLDSFCGASRGTMQSQISDAAQPSTTPVLGASALARSIMQSRQQQHQLTLAAPAEGKPGIKLYSSECVPVAVTQMCASK